MDEGFDIVIIVLVRGFRYIVRDNAFQKNISVQAGAGWATSGIVGRFAGEGAPHGLFTGKYRIFRRVWW